MTNNTPSGAKKHREVPNQKVARRPKCFSNQQHFPLSSAPAHRFFPGLKFEPLTEELWLPLRRHFFFT